MTAALHIVCNGRILTPENATLEEARAVVEIARRFEVPEPAEFQFDRHVRKRLRPLKSENWDDERGCTCTLSHAKGCVCSACNQCRYHGETARL
jgi:hypothetical protein